MLNIENLEPYLSAIGAIFSLATLGVVIRVAVVMRDVEQRRAAVIEERLANTQDDLKRTEKWSEREKQALAIQNESLRRQLEEILSSSGITPESLAAGASLSQATDSIQEALAQLLSKMEQVESMTDDVGKSSWHLELAKGYMAKEDWLNAARHFDLYISFESTDSHVQFSRGIAHANTRTNPIPALRAYNEAIALAPVNLDPNLLARYFSYRGAILKRMGRLKEAESDLNHALSLANHDYEIYDIKYNLACICAMQGKRDRMLSFVQELRNRPRELAAVRAHLTDYFSSYASDSDFLKLLNNSASSGCA